MGSMVSMYVSKRTGCQNVTKSWHITVVQQSPVKYEQVAAHHDMVMVLCV